MEMLPWNRGLVSGVSSAPTTPGAEGRAELRSRGRRMLMGQRNDWCCRKTLRVACKAYGPFLGFSTRVSSTKIFQVQSFWGVAFLEMKRSCL